ncbi:choice-of-anchor Q domain-containing protein [Proteiniphilum sp. UBA7639]|uniref:choice-of-anchor Q domain-containing protein n=1 Tax=Proteiniphilum sp. UBA7639 TaxID=1947289 RepID=UPI00257F4B0B|nr:choice-of-anchor Q domain-containing protein [Proteiniphilum sp. UBA7639]
MKIYNSIYRTLLGVIAFACVLTACDDSYEVRRVEPKIDVQESVTSSPQTMRMVVPLTSSYPWFAEASGDWINMTRYRGQALKADSIVFSCEENQSMDDREGWIEVRLMDQLSQRIKVVQKGRGSLITLPQSLVYFNRQGGEVIIEVVTHQEWQPEAASKDGFTFTKVDNGHLKITASLNSSGKDQTTEIKLFDKDRTTDATLSIIQKPVDKILFIPLEKEKKDIVIKKESFAIDIPVTLNVDYECVSSGSWIEIKADQQLQGHNVQNVVVSVDIANNQTGVERDGFVVIKNKGSVVEASDTLFIAQRGKNQIIYVKPGGNSDGTSWEQAFGSIHDAMGAASNNGDMEIWVASGNYQFSSTLTWKAVNVYGGFSGTETKLKERNLKNKPVFKGGNFNFMNAWNNNGDICWMDGIVFADCDNYANTGVGCFEIYKNHGFRNCEFRDIRHGKAIGYFEACKMVNCLFYNLHSQNYLIRANNSQLYNVTIANSLSDGWNSNYFHGGTKLYNTLIWNIKITGGSRTRAVVCGGDIPAVNCAIMNGLTEKGLVCSSCIELSADNSAPGGPHFTNPTGNTPDFSLAAGSICIDAGDSGYPGISVDIVGNTRIIGSSVDIGAYEYMVK